MTYAEYPCCFDSEGNHGEKNCISDLSSDEHICNNIEGIVWNDTKGPILPLTSYDRPCCSTYRQDDLYCKVNCGGTTYSHFTAANGIRGSGGRPRG